MGFIFSPCFAVFLRNFMTLMIVNGLWKQGVILVHGTLDQTQETALPYYDTHNHVHEDDHSHEDGFCDCNSQGPWQPLFKPSQVLPDESSDHGPDYSAENSIDGTSHGHLYTLPHDLHPAAYSGERKAKKQNHMIHLHLIPHIYVPVLHPVPHKLSYGLSHVRHPDAVSSPAGHAYGHHSGEDNLSTEQGGDEAHDDHGHEHEQFHDDHVPLHRPYGVPPQSGETAAAVHHDIPNHFDVHVPDGGHEADALAQNALPPSAGSANYLYYPHPAETHAQHQYEVHEEPHHDPYYGNYATGSNVKTQIVAPAKGANFDFSNAVAQQQRLADRSQLSKKHLDLPASMRRLRVMRPPPLGQKETWRTNLPRLDAKLFSKTFFDFKSFPKFDFQQSNFEFKPPTLGFKPPKLGFKQPTFDFKSPKFDVPQIPTIIPVIRPLPGKGVHPTSSITIHPTTSLVKREDKSIKTNN